LFFISSIALPAQVNVTTAPASSVPVLRFAICPRTRLTGTVATGDTSSNRLTRAMPSLL
jgi:hypothetical protein